MQDTIVKHIAKDQFVKVLIVVNQDIIDRIDAVAKARGKTWNRSAIFRMAVRRFLDELEIEEKTLRKAS